MTALEWTGWIGAALAWLTGGVFLWRAFVSRSLRRHCPNCDYIMLESGGLRCPECGHTPQNARSFHYGRFRRRRVAIAFGFIILGVILQAGPRIKQNGWIHSMPTTALILYADWGSSEAAFMEIRRRAFDDAVPKRVDPGRWQSDVLYEWQKTLLTRGCMNTLQPHRPRNLRLATLDLLGYRLTAANGDYTVLVSCLTDSDSVIQKKTESAIRTVWNFADEGFGARIRDQLLAIIRQDDQPMALYYAALFLDDNETIRPELYAWLMDDDPAFRILACHVLADEDESGAHIPVLIDLFINASDSVSPISGDSIREDAISLLSYNRLDSPGVLAELIKAIDHSDEQLPAAMISLIGRMGPRALPALDVLISKLDHSNRDVQTYAIEAIGAIGNEAHRAVPDLLRLVDGESYGLGGIALEAAIRIAPDPDQLASLLFDTLPQTAPYNRTALYRAMRWLDLTDDRIVSTLRSGLDDSHDEARAAAVGSLGFISPTSADIISMLLTALDDPDEKVRLASVAALVKHPEFAKEFEPRIRNLLANDDEEDVRVAAAKVLGSLSGDQETIDTLVHAIEDRDLRVRFAAIKALGSIGPKAASAIPALQDMLNQNTPYTFFIGAANAALELIERRDSTIPDS